MSIWDAARGEAAKEEAISRVERNASRAWLDEAYGILLTLCMEPGATYINTDDVWQFLHRRGVPAPHEPRAMSAVMRRGVSEALIVPTSQFNPSMLSQNHRRPIRLYRVVR